MNMKSVLLFGLLIFINNFNFLVAHKTSTINPTITTTIKPTIKPKDDKDVCSTRDSILSCGIKLPQDETASGLCANERFDSIKEAREWWQLAATKNSNDNNPHIELLTPKLNQSQQVVAAKARFDKDDMNWFNMYYTLITTLKTTGGQIAVQGWFNRSSSNYKSMNTYGDYQAFYHTFKSAVKKLSHLAPRYFSLPSDLTNFRDITVNEAWQQDRYFVQRRLAGSCPYFLRKVSKSKDVGMNYKDLNKLLNTEFDWQSQLRKVTNDPKLDWKKTLKSGRIFVLYHEEYNDIPRMEDILDDNPFDNHKLLDSPTPITLFALDASNQLQVIAIQKNYTQDSEVVVPDENDVENIDWLMAKGFVEIVDMAVCQLKGHLLDTHVTSEAYCNVFRRHLSSRHPLYQIMLAHCEGTTPVGALGITALVNEERYMHQLFNIGYKGTRVLINKYYNQQHYDDSDFKHLLKQRGLDTAEIADYPFRDDGQVVWNKVESFANKFVDLYYKEDKDVEKDWELNEFANEMSADGSIKDGAKYKGFPKQFEKKAEVVTFLTRFIWLAVQHAVNSYPLVPYSGYLPIAPTKLYDDTTVKEGSYAHHLPNSYVTMYQSVLTFTLGSIRVNRLFDYSSKLTDTKARCLVKDTYIELHTCVQTSLAKKNQERFENGDLTYQFMEPKWLPNSVHS